MVDLIKPVWYPAQGNGSLEGFWYPACTDGETIEMGFESAGACMQYLTRSGLASGGVHMSRKTGDKGTPITLEKPVRPVPLQPDQCRHKADRDRCAVCTAPDDPEPETEAERPAGMPDDPRFDWVEVTNFAGETTWIKGRCHHLGPAPVDLRTGQLVAWWCPDCGEQFEWDRWPVPSGLWVPLPEVDRSKIKGVEIMVPGLDMTTAEQFKERYADRLAAMADNPGYQIVYQNPKMNDDGTDKPLVVRALITYWHGQVRAWEFLKESVMYGWPVWLVIITYVYGFLNGWS